MPWIARRPVGPPRLSLRSVLLEVFTSKTLKIMPSVGNDNNDGCVGRYGCEIRTRRMSLSAHTFSHPMLEESAWPPNGEEEIEVTPSGTCCGTSARGRDTGFNATKDRLYPCVFAVFCLRLTTNLHFPLLFEATSTPSSTAAVIGAHAWCCPCEYNGTHAQP